MCDRCSYVCVIERGHTLTNLYLVQKETQCFHLHILGLKNIDFKNCFNSVVLPSNKDLDCIGGRTGLMVRASDSGTGDPGSILGRVGVFVSFSKRHLLPKSTGNTQE